MSELMDRVKELYESEDINQFFYNSIKKKNGIIPDDILESYVDEAVNMTALGINTNDEQKLYFYILIHIGDLLDSHLGSIEARRQMFPVIKYIIEHQENYNINRHNWLEDAVRDASVELNFQLKGDENHKKAYPMGDQWSIPSTVYSISKWIEATKNIYRLANEIGLDSAFADITKDWGEIERANYKRFLNFYQEGAHNKYKIAQFIPTRDMNHIIGDINNKLKAKLPEPKKEGPDINSVRDNIENQRSKIISRLNSAEKLLSSLSGQYFAGNDQEEMLKMLQDLKRKVQTANKLTVQSSLFEDYIYRASNALFSRGNEYGGRFFLKIAQEASQAQQTPVVPGSAAAPAAPPANPAAPPADPAVGPATDPSLEEPVMTPDQALSPMGAGDPMLDPSSEEGDIFETENAIKEFLKQIEEGVSDLDVDEINKDASLKRMAQALAPELISSQVKTAPINDLNPEDAIDAALNNVTVNDVVNRLELLSSFFMKREIPKQLAIVDLMMDRLGIGTFFPSLGEATRSALESNSYVSTRIDDILGKLQGAISSEEASQMFDDIANEDIEGSALANKLKQDRDDEQRRKENRKAVENAKQDEAISQVNELEQPAQIQTQEPLIDRGPAPAAAPAPAMTPPAPANIPPQPVR